MIDRDRGDKWLAYARAGIPVHWIVNIVERRIEVYTDPRQTGYQTCEVFTTGQTAAVVINGQQVGEIAVDDVLA